MPTTQTRIGGGGRIVIPAEYREKLGMREGEEVTLTLDDFGVRVSTARLALRHLQELAKTRVPKGKRVSDELIAERRAEARRELAEMKPRGRRSKK
jgi:AbrB family looped-hinge helix DNA binding protein